MTVSNSVLIVSRWKYGKKCAFEDDGLELELRMSGSVKYSQVMGRNGETRVAEKF